jgi:hypothetical protein
MSIQPTLPKDPSASTAEPMIPLADFTPNPEPAPSNIGLHPIQSLFIMVIASDRFGYCLYGCEIAPQDNCGAVMAKVQKAVIEAQSSIWDRILRLLFPILFTYVIGVAEYEEVGDLTSTGPSSILIDTLGPYVRLRPGHYHHSYQSYLG